MELDGALGDVELAGDFLVREILEQRIENFLFAAAEIGDRVSLQATPLAGENGVYEAREHGTRNPETALGYQRQSTRKLVARFGVGENSLHAEAQQRVAVRFIQRITHDNQTRIGVTLKNIGEQRSGSLASGVCVDHVDLRARRFEVAQVGSERGFQLF